MAPVRLPTIVKGHVSQIPSASRPAAPEEHNTVEFCCQDDSKSRRSNLQKVGNVVWQSGFLLADFLIRNPAFREWSGVRVVDLGTGTGKSRPY